jgi:type I restriction enzyme M protein
MRDPCRTAARPSRPAPHLERPLAAHNAVRLASMSHDRSRLALAGDRRPRALGSAITLPSETGFILTYLERAEADGLVSFGRERTSLTYTAAGRTVDPRKPEEKVRSELWAELIYRYNYPAERIGIEVTIPDRLPSDRADIVIFRDDAKTRPYAVIECKRDGISDAEFNQAIEQAAGNGTWSKLRAEYLMIIAGSTRRVLDFSDSYGMLERTDNIVADLPRAYGKLAEYRYRRDGEIDIQPVSKDELISALKKCHQSLWGGGRLSPPSAFGELAKLIFVKVNDELAPRRPGEPYQFQVRSHEPLTHFADRVRKLYEAERLREPDVFTDEIRISDEILRTIVSHLEGINLSATDVDVKGLAFETFMDNFFKGDYGQYFTPREVIAFATKLVDPSRDEKVIDPASGSGGFLLHALSYIRDEASMYYTPGTVEHHRFWDKFATQNLYGIEVNEEISRVAKMNMILNGDGHTNIVRSDSLLPFDELYRLNRGVTEKSFDIVVTNPPFGAQVSLAEQPYLANYVLGRNTGKQRKSQKTEILFLERIHSLLKPGTGRAAVIVPDGILTNASLQYVRDFILEHFRLQAVISLPTATFAHFGTAVKSSIILLRRYAENEPVGEDDPTFMAISESVGYDTVGRPQESDLDVIFEEWARFKATSSI